ncbi:hypothetical protein F511_42164 [Dorcoceras hygrometricum]|uniref:Uncharacterized protein n=1 Tax=Dorcoceras hygrometricum TaxID=472368 RepID=A0A2Z7C5T2_9LAMI|nr:hypothetical protein F511_42164 [Dorcoceras hygrometricum]
MLRGDAMIWWEGAKLTVDLEMLTWEEFKRIFSSRESCRDCRSRRKLTCFSCLCPTFVNLLRCVVPEKSNAIIGVVTTGFECLPPSCDGLTGSEDHGPMISPVDTLCGFRG